MPVVKTFRGRAVSRLQQRDGGILITFASVVAGQRKDRILVSQQEWDEHGTSDYITRDSVLCPPVVGT